MRHISSIKIVGIEYRQIGHDKSANTRDFIARCVVVFDATEKINWTTTRNSKKKMSSDGGDGDETVYGHLPGSLDYVSSRNVQPITSQK